jgi:hypothetical protein
MLAKESIISFKIGMMVHTVESHEYPKLMTKIAEDHDVDFIEVVQILAQLTSLMSQAADDAIDELELTEAKLKYGKK